MISAFRNLGLGLLALGLLATSPLMAQGTPQDRSQSAYLNLLRQHKFDAWHFSPWHAVTHPIDFWVRHTSDERKSAQGKVNNFIKGVEFLPDGFEETQIKANGLTLQAAVYLVDETPRPMVVLIPGTFGSHKSSYLGETARLLASTGKFHVMLLATRMSISTIQQMKVLGSGGYFEGEDIREVIRWTRTKSPWAGQVTKIGLYGVSLSSDYVIQTMAYDTDRLVDAGLMVCGAFDPEALAKEIDRKGTGMNRVRYPWAGFFLKAQRMQTEFLNETLDLKLTKEQIEAFTLSKYAPELVWPMYKPKYQEKFGPSFEYADFQRLCRTINIADKVQRPLLAIHSHNDNWLGSKFSDEFKAKVASNANVALEYVDGAGHASYFIHDPEWFRDLLDTYFSYWLDPAPANASRGASQVPQVQAPPAAK